MKPTHAASPIFDARRWADSDDATFSQQVNAVTDTFDALAVRSDDARLSDARNPLPGSVTLATIPNASITGAKLAASTITETNLAIGSVGSPEIIDGSIANVDLGSNVVDSRVLAVGGVSTPNIGDGQVTAAKLAATAQLALNQPGDLILSAASARAGAVLCDGSAYSRTSSTYAALFAAIGTAYGGGDGSTTFNVPDYRGRALVVAGAGAGLTARALGALFGEEMHTRSVYEMAARHGLNWSDLGHSHGTSQFASTAGAIGNVAPNGISGSYAMPWSSAGWGGASGTAGAYTGISASIQANGNSGAHNNVQPSAGVNVFIKL